VDRLAAAAEAAATSHAAPGGRRAGGLLAIAYSRITLHMVALLRDMAAIGEAGPVDP